MLEAIESKVVKRYDFCSLCDNKNWLPIADIFAGKVVLIIERYWNDTIFFHQITTTSENSVVVRTFSNCGSETTDTLHNDEQIKECFLPDMDWITDITIYYAKESHER